MRNVREILRLRYEHGCSLRQIAASCRVATATVGDTLRRAEAAGLRWPLPDELDDERLESLLYPGNRSSALPRPLPNWEAVDRELRRKGVTLHLLWLEYKERHPDGYQYARFCELYRAWKGRQDLVLRQAHKAGEKMFVDFAGQTVPIVDKRTGEVHEAYLFVAVLGASSYTYACVVRSQDRFSWLMGHVNALEYFGGVPAVIVPDNTKAGITHASYYEPEPNPAYQEFALHYGVVILPARPRKPRDKAKVESAVQVAERFILARLRNHTFFSVEEANKAVRPLLEELNRRPFQKREGSRASLFAEIDRPALRPLPARRYEYAEWKRARVNVDYHVEVKGAYYSVPHRLVKEEVMVRLTSTVVEVFHRNRRVASHPRLHGKGEFSTLEEHMPASHRRHRQAPSFLLQRAEEVGPGTKALVEKILETRRHPEQGYRACLGILRLRKRYSAERLEAACRRALAIGALSYHSVASILGKGLDRVAYEGAAEGVVVQGHRNLRGPEYYSQGGGA